MDVTSKHTADYIKELRSNGRYTFTEDDLFKSVHKDTKNIRKDLDRLRAKGVIKNIRRSFYTIIPEEYSHMGMLPADFYIDDTIAINRFVHYICTFTFREH